MSPAAPHAGPPAPLAAGGILAGRFLVVRPLGRGVLAWVYEAEDLAGGGRVAIKRLHPALQSDRRARECFESEVEVGRRLDHPGVRRVFELFAGAPEERRGRCLASPRLAGGHEVLLRMELLAGATLAQRLRGQGPFSSAEALAVLAQVAAALDAVHERGIVHRDVKSGNIFLVPARPGPRAVVTDFGIALTETAAVRQEAAAEAAGRPVRPGSPGYRAPESAAGGEVTGAADIYSLGVVACEMLAGRRPVRGVPPRGLHPSWRRALRRCLAVDPELRFRSAGEFVAALAKVESEPLQRPPRGGRDCASRGDRSGPEGAARVADPGRGRLAAEPYSEGLAHLRRGDPAAATVYLAQAAALDPAPARCALRLAEAWLELDREEEAGAALSAARAASSSLEPAARRELDALQCEVGARWRSAAEVYEELVREGGAEWPRWTLRLAAVRRLGGSPRAALAALETLRAGGPAPRSRPATDSGEGLLAAAHLEEARCAQALADLRRQSLAGRRAARSARRQGAEWLEGRALLLAADAWRQCAGARSQAAALAALERAAQIFARRGDLSGQADAARLAASVAGHRREPAMFGGCGGRGERGAHHQQALALARRAGSRRALADSLTAIGNSLCLEGQLERAREFYEQALALRHALGDPIGAAHLGSNLAMVSCYEGSYATARSGLERALQAYAKAGCLRHTGRMLHLLGRVAFEVGDLAVASAYLGRAVEVGRSLGDRSDLAAVLATRAQVLREGACLQAARSDLELASSFNRHEVGCRVALLWMSGAVHRSAGDLVAARGALEASYEMARQAGRAADADTAALDLARVDLDESRLEAAEQTFHSVVRRCRQRGEEDVLSAAACGLTRCLAARGEEAAARRALAEALACRRVCALHQLERALVAARLGLQSPARDAPAALEALILAAEQAGFNLFALEARLALGQALLTSGSRRRGREVLAHLERHGRALGCGHLALSAALSLARSSTNR